MPTQTTEIKAGDLALDAIGRSIRLEYPRFRDGVRPMMSWNSDHAPLRGPFRTVEGIITGIEGVSLRINETKICSPDEEWVFQLAEVHLEIDGREIVKVDPFYEVEILS